MGPGAGLHRPLRRTQAHSGLVPQQALLEAPVLSRTIGILGHMVPIALNRLQERLGELVEHQDLSQYIL